MSALQIFMIFLKLGFTSFGGPVAHLGYFRTEFVDQKRWFTDKEYADLVALCQFMPGPASSQVGFAIGYKQGGYLGALAAFIGFTLPSAVVMIGLGVTLMSAAGQLHGGMMQGLKVVAVAVVAQAVWGMGKNLCKQWGTRVLALLSALLLLFAGSFYSQFLVILLGGIIGVFFFQTSKSGDTDADHQRATPKKQSWVSLSWIIAFFILLFGLPVLPALLGAGQHDLAVQLDGFYRSGALVFGGGHVVLPLLQQTVMPMGWIENDVFLAGYGAAQAMPGPLFTFAGFLGGAIQPATSSSVLYGWTGGLVSLLMIFLPGFLLILGVLPFWDQVRQNIRMQAALVGVNAAVVGVLLAALITPVATTGILDLPHAGLALIALYLLEKVKLAPWLVVIMCAGAGWLILS